MNSAKLRITGPDSAPYVLGAPMHIHEGATHIATMDPVPVNRVGTEVHLEHFTPIDPVALQKREIGKLLLVEVAAFIIENFTTVQAISFALTRNIDSYGDAMKLASMRSGVLQSIGTEHIVIAPKPDAVHAGHFVVSGLWEYNPSSVAALHAVLKAERDAYDEREALAARDRASPRIDAWVRRFFPRGTLPGDAGESTR